MKTHVLRGSKEEIAQNLIRIAGEVRDAIVFEEEPAEGVAAGTDDADDIFAEMRAYIVNVEQVDDSREATYTRMEGE